MNAFVTRYRPRPDEAELKKHIDGANVDGSVILALPTDEPFQGGKLKVWDGRPTVLHEYAMAPGDCIFLDARVWHQGCAISSAVGLAVDGQLRVTRPDGRPIDNLYAAGEMLGSSQTMGKAACGGMMVTPAMTFGRLLGQKILPL